ncbi:hypothetical protein TRFO_29134 [Tritrichomonas foetus]|uniref:PAS domain-containing protein n=1 Tax=Tritrichomonas foetus TaxID=1144522 RepID=A0A1J4JYH2_9EUKA|nr:hypothetical protein TRFO_29134 [Tritrichomonas foetus]|eukprot:OHT03520.1 hypothetical protein TRFO_29134 [Tritrichomonas foetus]
MQIPSIGGNILPKAKPTGLFAIIYPIASIHLLMINIPRIANYIPNIFLNLQAHFIAHWLPYHEKPLPEYNLVSEILFFDPLIKQLSSDILFFDPLIKQLSSDIFDYLVVILNALQLLIFICSSWFFSKYQMLFYAIHITIVVFFDIVYPIVMVPSLVQAGHHIASLYSQVNTYDIILMSFLIIFIIVNFSLMFLYYKFLSCSVYIKDEPFYSYDGTFKYLTLIIPGVFGFFQKISPLISKDFQFVIILLHIILNIIMLIWCFWPPHAQIYGTVIYGANFLSIIVLDIWRIVYPTHKPIFIVISLIIYIFCFILVWIFIKIRVGRLVKSRTNKEIVLRFRISMITNSNFNESLIDFTIDNIKTDTERLQIARFCSLFPEFYARSYELITSLRKVKTFSIFEGFLQQEIFHLQMLRQSYCRVAEIDKMTSLKSSIVCLQKLTWQRIKFQNSFVRDCEIYFIRNSMCTEIWKTLISKYPNNVLVAHHYSKFLLDCKMDYENAALWENRSLQLEEGKVFQYDEGIVHLLRSYPFYADRVLGNITLTSMNDLEVNVKNQIIKRMTNEPELRTELQHALTNLKPKYIPFITLINILKVLFIISLWIFCILSISSTYVQSNDIFEMIQHFETLSTRGTIAAISYMTKFIEIEFKYEESLYYCAIDQYDPDYHIHSAYTALYYYNLVINWSCSHTISNKMKNILFETEIPNITQIDEIKNTPFVCNEMYFLTCLITVQKLYSKSVLLSGNILNDMIDMLIDEVCDYGINVANIEGTQNLTLFIITGSITFILFILIYYFLFFLYFRYLKKIQKLLKSVPKEVIDNAYAQSEINENSNETRNNFSFSEFLFLIDFIFTLLLVGGQIFYYTKTNYQINFYIDLIKELKHVIQRKTRAYQILYDATSIMLYPDQSKTLWTHMAKKLTATNEAHYYGKKSNIYKYDVGSKINQVANQKNCIGGNHNPQPPNCLNIDESMVKFRDLVTHFVNEPSHRLYSELFESLFSYFTYTFDNIITFIAEIIQDQADNSMGDIFRPALGFIFGSLFGLFFGLLLNHQMCNIFRAAILLIQKINPTDLINNREIIDFLFSNKQDKIVGSSAENIVLNSTIPTTVLNHEGIVLQLNPAFSSYFEYDELHIVGQHMSKFIHDDNGLRDFESIVYRIVDSLLISDCKIMKGDGRLIECELTLVPFYEAKGKMKYCSVIFIDKYALKMQKKQCEEINTQCNNLISFLNMNIPRKYENCVITIIKFSNFEIKKLNYFENIYNDVGSFISHYKTMNKLFIGNGVIVVTNESHDAALESVELSEKIVEYIDEKGIHCGFSIVIAKGTFESMPLKMKNRDNRLLKGTIIKMVRKLVEMHKMGHIVVSQEIYDEVANHDIEFFKEEGEIPCYSIEIRKSPLYF